MRKLPVLALALLAACSTVQDSMETKVDYKSVVTVVPLDVPPDLTAPGRDNRYVVPETKSSATFSGYQAERRDSRTGTTGVLPDVEGIHVERAGNQRWLVVPQPAEKVYPVVREFWQEAGFLLKVEMPEAGVMETDWAENRARISAGPVRDLLGRFLDQLYSTAERDKFRTRLDRTPDGKGTEIYISHRGMQEVYTTARDTQTNSADTRWQPREPDAQLEAEFLRRLMIRLGAHEEKAKQQLAAAGTPLYRAELRKGNAGTEVLQVLEPFDRAWRRVGLALDRVGFTVEDRDRQKGLYYVRYADPEGDGKDRSTWDRISGLFSSDPKVKAEQYRVLVTQAGTEAEVSVLNKEGAQDGSKTAQRILTLLHEQLK
jgi:outer membrane protein assembly factor BamC